jgi:hypothetical protein
MPATISELLNGGIVTARHPSLLQPGQLQRADDCVYRINDPAIWRAPGRVKVNSVALGTVWAGAAEGVKGLAHLTFEKQRADQLVAYSGATLSCANLTATSATAPTSGLDAIDLQISCTTTLVAAAATTTVTSAALFTGVSGRSDVQVGMRVTGSTIAPGTTVVKVTDASTIVLSRKFLSAATATLTFNGMTEITGPGLVAGTGANTTTFVASTGYPFTQDAIGMFCINFLDPSIKVLNVSGQSGTTGRYSTVTLSAAASASASDSLAFEGGVVAAFSNIPEATETLDFSQYGGIYYLWNGHDETQHLAWRERGNINYSSEDVGLIPVLVSRPCGLRPVTEQPPAIALLSGSTYSWPISLPPGKYWFLVTEIQDLDSNDLTLIEGTYLGKEGSKNGVPVGIDIAQNTDTGVRLTFPTRVNTGGDKRISSHWGVYMSPIPSDKAPALSLFKRIAKVRMTANTAQTYDIYETTAPPQVKAPTATATVGTLPAWTNANGIKLRELTTDFATAASSYPGPATPTTGIAPCESSGTTFAFSTGSPYSGYSITGIRVKVVGKKLLGNNPAQAYVYVQSGTKKTANQYMEFGDGWWQDRYFGGNGDTLGVAWGISDLTNIVVNIGKTWSSTGNNIVNIDYVELTVFFQSANLDLNGPSFRVVTYRDQIGSVVDEPAKGIPPSASTGDVYQGSQVLNNLADETEIRFSLPGDSEAFPKPYVMRFNSTKRKDRVKYIRTLGDMVIIGMENSIERVNYLPTEIDTDFHEGISHGPIAVDHGIPGPLCAVKFDWPGRGTVIAYVSTAGVFLTDGLTTRPLNSGLDWQNTVKLSALGTAVMRVYPREKWLVLYYCPSDATHSKNTKALIFHYSADHAEGTELPVTGPMTVSGRASTEVIVAGKTFLFTGHETDGFVYQEDFGVAQASGYQVHNAAGSLASAPIVPIVKTRRLHPAGITHDTHLYKAYLLFSPYGASSTVSCTFTLAAPTTVTSSAGFTSALVGTRVSGTGIDAGTIVKSVETTSSLTLSRAVNAAGTAVTLTFDTGTIAMSSRGASIGEAPASMHVVYGSTRVGDMLVMMLDDTRQGLEIQIEKVPLTFTTNADGYRFDTATWVDLSVAMRLHQIMIQFDDQGPEQSRAR